MRTTIITRQTLHHGAEHLAIVRSDRAYYVIHIDAAQHCTALADAQFWSYEAAYTRLRQEVSTRAASPAGSRGGNA